MAEKDVWDAVERVKVTIGDDPNLTPGDKREAIGLAWHYFAKRARKTAAGLPGGFPDEQARQLAFLESLMVLIRDDRIDSVDSASTA